MSVAADLGGELPDHIRNAKVWVSPPDQQDVILEYGRRASAKVTGEDISSKGLNIVVVSDGKRLGEWKRVRHKEPATRETICKGLQFSLQEGEAGNYTGFMKRYDKGYVGTRST